MQRGSQTPCHISGCCRKKVTSQPLLSESSGGKRIGLSITASRQDRIAAPHPSSAPAQNPLRASPGTKFAGLPLQKEAGEIFIATSRGSKADFKNSPFLQLLK